MSHPLSRSRSSKSLLHITPSCRTQRFLIRRYLLLMLFLGLLLFSELLGNGSFLIPPAYATGQSTLPSAPATMTYQQFLKEKRADKSYHGPLVFPQQTPVLPSKTPHSTNYTQLLPSAEPVTMKPLVRSLAPTFLQGGAGITPLDFVGSDGRLEIQVQPGTFDPSHATIASGGSPIGNLTLHLS